MKNCLIFIFGKIWTKSLCYSTGTLARFRSNSKMYKKSSFDQNQLKLFYTAKEHVHVHVHVHASGKI